MAAGETHAALTEIAVKEYHTRLLVPFVTAAGAHRHVRASMADQLYRGTSIWVAPNTRLAAGAYSQEILPDLRDFLFSNDMEACVYAYVDHNIAQKWFRNRFRVIFHRKSEPSSDFQAALLPSPGIEVFVSPLGGGVLSIGLSLIDSSTLPLSSFLTFSHDIAQLIPQKSPWIRLPLPQGQSGEFEKQMSFEARLGTTGSAFRLGELSDFLLTSIRRVADVRMLQSQCSAYTVARCAVPYGLTDGNVRTRIVPFLSALTQLEEATHADEASASMSIPNCLLNQCHWAAVSSIATAHVICDQEFRDHEFSFNAQRLGNIRDKYFVPYLFAFLQRLALSNIVHEAEAAAAASSHEVAGENRQIHDVRMNILRLSAQFASYSVSSRDAINRYYRLCEQGMELSRALMATKQTIDALEECEQTQFESSIGRKIDQNLGALTNMQRTVGWLEMFFAAVYGMELFKALGEGLGYESHYSNLTAVGWGAFCGGVAALITKPWKHARIRWGVVLPTALLMGAAVSVWMYFAHS